MVKPNAGMTPPPATKSQGMTFAEKQLQRHGWTEGKGLGRRENGISEAIKVKVKCDTAGVGHNSAEQFTFHWWDHVFNKTASSISVESDQDGVQVKKVTGDETTVTNRKPRKALTNRNMLYGRFIKSATLLSGGETPVVKESSSESSNSSGDEDEKLDLSSATKLTDEDLVKICGGRTAHKGARHGLTMSAKLSRIEEQERAFLEKYGTKELKNKPLTPNGELSSANKERRKKIQGEEATQNDSPHITWVNKKKKRKKTSNDEEKDKTSTKKTTVDKVELPKEVNGLDGYNEDSTTWNKKNLVEETTDHLIDHVQHTEDDLNRKKKKKEKAANVEVSETANDLEEDRASSGEDKPPQKKKKKRRVTDNEDERPDERQETVPSEEESQKSSKKKRKNDMGEREPDESAGRLKRKKKKQKENRVSEADECIEKEDCAVLMKRKTTSSDRSLEEAEDNTDIKRKKKRKDKSS